MSCIHRKQIFFFGVPPGSLLAPFGALALHVSRFMSLLAQSEPSSSWMALAHQSARAGLFRTSPNPRVGCVLVSTSEGLLGQGSTQRAGGAHAEIMALQDAASRGHSVVGATAYVTLEPCAHQGRTGPCCDALIAAGVRRVVASLTDPNPLVAGQGFARLRAAGVVVEVGPGAHEARELNLGFFSRMVRGMPWVRMKAAASLDGQTALANGASQWITSEAARADGQRWRARACTVLTGIGTVLADNPRLDVRAVETQRQPRLAIVDSQLRTPPDAALFVADREVLIYAGAMNGAQGAAQAALEARGALVVRLPGVDGRVDLAGVVRDLAQRGTNELHVEAGHTLNGALLRAQVVDELLFYMAPALLGPGRPAADLMPLTALHEKIALEFREVERVGPDLRILARLQGRDVF